MKVLDLQCSQGHSFEGWFGSQGDYDSQRARGMVTCPACNDSDIVKKLSAPRLNLGHAAAANPVSASTEAQGDAAWQSSAGAPPPATPSLTSSDVRSVQQLQAVMLQMVRQVMAHTEDVGPQFAEEARKMHYGEKQERSIRGQATREETEALIEEGIDVVPLPLPEHLKGPLQ
ncbi:MAG: hypothetical protein RIT44_1510 [Pseudomonadota bacterium]|jgi:hypothetical protein